MVEERGSRKAGCTGRATDYTVVLKRKANSANFSRKQVQDNIKYWLKDIQRAVTQKPTNKEKIDFILDHLTRDAFEEV